MPERPEERHAVLIRAALPHLAPHWVLSHVSAAVVHGLPIWRLAADHVHVSRGGSGGARVTRGVHRHVNPLPEDDVTVAGGLTVTSLARTVSDIARSAPFEQALVIADAALSTELITAADLRAQYERIVFAEKEREDAIRAEDHGVVRWTWRDLSRFGPIAERIRRRLT